MNKEKITDVLNKSKQIFLKFIDKIMFHFKLFYIRLSFLMAPLFLFIIIISWITGIFSPKRDYNFIISTAINGIILSATLALLTFTYALVLNYPEKKNIITIGKKFLNATLNFILGIIFLGLFALSLEKYENRFNLPDFIIDSSLLILFFIGLFAFVMSVYYFSFGIGDLLKKIL